jgi:hypothetical protein
MPMTTAHISDDCTPIERISIQRTDGEELVIKRYRDGSILLRDPERDDSILLDRHMLAHLIAIASQPLPE